MIALNNRYDIIIFLEEKTINEKDTINGKIKGFHGKKINDFILKHDSLATTNILFENENDITMIITDYTLSFYNDKNRIGVSYQGGIPCSDLFICNINKLQFPENHTYDNLKAEIESISKEKKQQ